MLTKLQITNGDKFYVTNGKAKWITKIHIDHNKHINQHNCLMRYRGCIDG